MVKTLFLLFAACGFISLISGCDSDPSRRQMFSRERVLNDSTGGAWIVTHNFGDNYFIRRQPHD